MLQKSHLSTSPTASGRTLASLPALIFSLSIGDKPSGAREAVVPGREENIDIAFAEEGEISKGSRLSRASSVRKAKRGQVLITGAVGRYSFLTRQPKARGPDVFGREVMKSVWPSL
jgi:hypothetical protein